MKNNKNNTVDGSKERMVIMAKANRNCIACKRSYRYCGTCAADANKPTWMALFCCENCRNLYNIINDYRHKLLSKEEACKKLKELDLSSVDELPKTFKESYDEIMHEAKEEKVVEMEIPKETVIEESNVEPITEAIQETKVIEEKVEETKTIEEMIVKPRKKNYYRKNPVENTEE